MQNAETLSLTSPRSPTGGTTSAPLQQYDQQQQERRAAAANSRAGGGGAPVRQYCGGIPGRPSSLTKELKARKSYMLVIWF